MKSVQAVWEGVVIAETDEVIVVEGNYYFPSKSIRKQYLQTSDTRTNCPWKGEAAYYSIKVGDKINKDAVWTYPKPSKEASRIQNFFAFWKGVEIQKEDSEHRNNRISHLIREYAQEISHLDSAEDVLQKTKNIMSQLGVDALFGILPEDFIQDLSFFNFQNSNNLCFHTNSKKIIHSVNPTFEWSLNHMPDFVGKSLQEFLSSFEIIDGPDQDKFFANLASHGWVRVPKIRTKKGQKWVYYNLDVAITKHGELDSLQGIQGELVDITREVELSESLSESEANMKSLLDGLTSGLFFFDQDGKVAEQRSSALQNILPGSDGCATIQQFSERYSKLNSQTIKAALELLWPVENDDFFSDFSTTVSMLPSKILLDIDNDKRDIIFEYRPLHGSNGKLDKVIVIVTDVTEHLKNEREAILQAERVRKISKAAAGAEAFLGFRKESDSLFLDTNRIFHDGNSDETIQLKRNLHTLKGSLGIYEFNQIAHSIHLLEDKISEGCLASDHLSCLEEWNAIFDRWVREIDDICQVLRLKANHGEVSVDREKISRLFDHAIEKKDKELTRLADGLLQQPLEKAFVKYQDYIDKLAERFPEKSVKIAYVQDSAELGYAELQSLDGALIHILRNCLDHGIEGCEQRTRLGKAGHGTISIGAERSEDMLTIRIKDDGRGVNSEKLAEKAVQSGVWTSQQAQNASEHDKLSLIFVPNLSAKDNVTEVSGRGVGMDAVKAYVESLNGIISIESKKDEGTFFEIKIPRESVKKLDQVA